MKTLKTSILLLFVAFSFQSMAQFIAKVEMKKELEGICDKNEVYALFGGLTGQVEPSCSIKKEQMESILNEKVTFIKTNPKFKSKGMVGVVINCEGVVVEWSISMKSSNKELDQEILEVFKEFDKWTAGKLDGKPVDSKELISYEIKKGKILLK